MLIFLSLIFTISAICLVYIVWRINWLLKEKEEELSYRSLKVGDEVLKNEGSEDNDDMKKMIDRRIDAMGKNIKSLIPGKKDTLDTKGTYEKRNQMH